METFKVIVSTRFKNNPVAKMLKALDVEMRYIALRRGDLILADRFGVKYLSKADFLDLIKKRLFYKEILELKREYPNSVIIVEGDDPLHDPSLDQAAIQGAVLFASVLNGIPVLTTATEVESGQMLFMLTAQVCSNPEWQQIFLAKPMDTAKAPVLHSDNGNGDPRVGIIAGLPEVGPALAEGLLQHFGTLSKLFAAKVDDLKKVEGIGPKRAQKIFAFLNQNQAA